MFFETDAIYHIYNRSNETIFYNRENYLFFTEKVKRLISPACSILSWVLMPNHFHFLIQATAESCKDANERHRPALQILSKNIGTLLSSYTLALNQQHGRRGSLFAHQTKAKILNESYPIGDSNRLAQFQLDYATACFLYIHQNPVKAGLVSKLEDWEFSSFRDYAGLRNGKLIHKELAFGFINLDFDNFLEQSKVIVDENLMKKIY
jgi:putative transposase